MSVKCMSLNDFHKLIKESLWCEIRIEEIQNILEFCTKEEREERLRLIDFYQQQIFENNEMNDLSSVRTLNGKFFPEAVCKALKQYESKRTSWKCVIEIAAKYGIA